MENNNPFENVTKRFVTFGHWDEVSASIVPGSEEGAQYVMFSITEKPETILRVSAKSPYARSAISAGLSIGEWALVSDTICLNQRAFQPMANKYGEALHVGMVFKGFAGLEVNGLHFKAPSFEHADGSIGENAMIPIRKSGKGVYLSTRQLMSSATGGSYWLNSVGKYDCLRDLYAGNGLSVFIGSGKIADYWKECWTTDKSGDPTRKGAVIRAAVQRDRGYKLDHLPKLAVADGATAAPVKPARASLPLVGDNTGSIAIDDIKVNQTVTVFSDNKFRFKITVWDWKGTEEDARWLAHWFRSGNVVSIK